MALRTARWKYIRTYDADAPSRMVFEELYDMEKDPEETTNLVIDGRYSNMVEKLAGELERQRESLERTRNEREGK